MERKDGAEDDGAEHDVAHRIREKGTCKRRAQRGQEKRAAEHAEIMSAAAGDYRAADDDSGGGGQEVLVAHAVEGLAIESGQHDADWC